MTPWKCRRPTTVYIPIDTCSLAEVQLEEGRVRAESNLDRLCIQHVLVALGIEAVPFQLAFCLAIFHLMASSDSKDINALGPYLGLLLRSLDVSLQPWRPTCKAQLVMRAEPLSKEGPSVWWVFGLVML